MSRDDLFERYFPHLLCAITIVALVPRLIVGITAPLTIDGYWKIFIATQDRWSNFFAQNQHDEHPMPYRLLLRLVGHFGSSRLVLRTTSVIPGLATIYVVGLIASKLCRRKSVALLAAIAWGFSTTIVDLSCELRAYSLALLFVVVAFYHLTVYLNGHSLSGQKRSLIWFGVVSAAAIGTEFYAVLLVSSALIFFAAMSVRHRQFRRDTLRWILVKGHPLAIAFALPSMVAVALFFIHFHNKMFPHLYLAQFYWLGNESALQFVLKNLRSEFNLIAPIEIVSAPMCLALFTIALIATFYFSYGRAKPTRALAATTPALMLVLLVGQLIVLSLWARYPFGGALRHQSIIFPFTVVAAFVALDRCVAALPGEAYRKGTLALVALTTAFLIQHRWPSRAYQEEQGSAAFKDFRTSFSSAGAIYLDQCSLLNYYSQTSGRKWTFVRHYHEGDAIDSYLVSSADAQEQVFRNLDRFFFDLHSPEFYGVLRRLMVKARLQTLTLFFLNWQSPHVIVNDQTIRSLAGDAGLRVDTLQDANYEVFAAFSLRQPP